MTRVCLVGADDVNLRYELLSRETAREALATYDLREPFENAVGIETMSLGAAVALLNDLNWYLVRFVDEAMVLEASVSEGEWLSRDLATGVRDDTVDPDEVDRFLKIYGLADPTDADADEEAASESGPTDGAQHEAVSAESGGQGTGASTDASSAPEPSDGSAPGHSDRNSGPKRLVEPMFVTRTGGNIPEYDLRDVEETVIERVTESEFGA